MLSKILQDQHFQNFASIIRGPFNSKLWRDAHPQIATLHLLADFNKKTPIDADWNLEQVIESFTNLITALSEASINDIIRLSYTTDDYNWFVGSIQSENHKTIISMLKAYYSAPEPTLSIKEMVEATSISEDTWKRRCRSGQLPGVVKVDNAWKIPKSLADIYNKQ